MLLVIGGIKGGTGKTTIATNLCQMRASAGKKVLLVDADEQQSAFDWSLQRDESKDQIGSSFATICLTGKAVYTNLRKMRGDYDDIIIDTGGRDTTSLRSALCDAEKFIMPFKPSSIDIWTIGSIRKMLLECTNMNLESYVLINQGDFKGKDNKDAIRVLEDFKEVKCLPVCIRNRKSFRTAAAYGLSIFELNNKDEKACKEMNELYKEIYGNYI